MIGASVGCAALCLAGRGPAVAQSQPDAPTPQAGILPIPEYRDGPLRRRDRLLGDLGGARTGLARRGVQLDIDWVQHLQSVVSGGRDTGTEYGGSLDSLLRLDLQQMDLMPGALVTLRAESRYGNSVNGEARALLPVNTDLFFPLAGDRDDDLPLVITELTYTQFLSPKVGLFIGKLNTLGGDPNEFASGRGKTQFGAAEFVFNPVTALAVPYSTLGGGALWMPSERLTVTASIFNTADSSTTAGFDDFGDGWTATVEVQLRHALGRLPGGQNLGFIYAADADFMNLRGRFDFDPQTGLSLARTDETWSIYWSAWQYLWTDPSDERPIDLANGLPDRRGVGLFARAGAGDHDTLPIDWHLSGGVGGRGLIPGRPDDHFGVGYFYDSVVTGNLAGALRLESDSQGLEAFYNAALTPAAWLTLSVQAVDDIDSRTDTAVVIGARLQLVF